MPLIRELYGVITSERANVSTPSLKVANTNLNLMLDLFGLELTLFNQNY